jgi:glutathione peroxidase
LADYKGKVVLVVNVASQCGYSPQYSALEATYEKYKDKGFVILGFPANNFGAQEPGTNEEIKTFCTRKYSVTFRMYSKISVKGADQSSLYTFLTKNTGPGIAGEIKWNFTKFLVDRNGNVIQRFEPAVTPDSNEVISAIEKRAQATQPDHILEFRKQRLYFFPLSLCAGECGCVRHVPGALSRGFMHVNGEILISPTGALSFLRTCPTTLATADIYA